MNLFHQIAVMLQVGLGKLTDERRSDRGVTAAEYGLILALVAIAIIAAVTLLGGSLSSIFTSASNSISGN